MPPLPALDPEALAAALANAPDMDDLPPPDDTVLEAPDMPLEIPDEGVLAAELAEPELPEGDNPLKDEMRRALAAADRRHGQYRPGPGV